MLLGTSCWCGEERPLTRRAAANRARYAEPWEGSTSVTCPCRLVLRREPVFKLEVLRETRVRCGDSSYFRWLGPGHTRPAQQSTDGGHVGHHPTKHSPNATPRAQSSRVKCALKFSLAQPPGLRGWGVGCKVATREQCRPQGLGSRVGQRQRSTADPWLNARNPLLSEYDFLLENSCILIIVTS